MYFDDHGKAHHSKETADYQSKLYRREADQAQAEAAENTAEIARLTRMQTKIVAEKADYDRIVSHLDGESDESKWDTIRPYIENDIYTAISEDALNAIKASWEIYLGQNGLKEKFNQLVSERRKLEKLGRELISIRARKPYPTVLLKNLKTAGGESSDRIWRIVICVLFYPITIPVGVGILIYNYPPKIKKLMETKEVVKSYNSLLESLNVDPFISERKSTPANTENYSDIVWNHVAHWQNQYPPRCRMKRNDQLFADEIEFIVFSAYDDFKSDPLAVILAS
jgi:hypothetical protein